MPALFNGIDKINESPLYDGVAAKTDVLGTPLYEELKAMWLQLGVKQGMVRDDRARRS